MKYLLAILPLLLSIGGCQPEQKPAAAALAAPLAQPVAARAPQPFKSVLHKAETRGETRASWLLGKHTFSFNRYYDPDRMNFGLLRVLNDDHIAGGGGFPTHPHENMEIVTIQLEGGLAHRDNTGGSGTIRPNEVQVMTAGTGVQHSEVNASATEASKLLQIWVFPKEMGLTPRYDQKRFDPAKRQGRWQTLVAPNDPEALMIHQDAVFSRGSFPSGTTARYDMHFPSNGVYAFILSGACRVNGQPLQARDGFGVWDTSHIEVEATADTEILLIEVPMINR